MLDDCLDKWYKCGLQRLKRFIDRQIAKGNPKALGNAEEVPKAAKPYRFTIKAHIYIGFVVTSVFALGIVASMIITMVKMERGLRLNELAQGFFSNVSQARAFEKDYFIYGTGLRESRDIMKGLEKLVITNYGELRGYIDYESSIGLIAKYVKLLESLEELDREKNGIDQLDKLRRRESIQREIKQCGYMMANSSDKLLAKGRDTAERLMLIFRTVQMYSVVFLVLFMLFISHLLGKRVLSAINLFSKYSTLMASGQYARIMSDHQYNDEFSDLSMAIDYLIKELDRQQQILAQSQKLRAVGTLTSGIAHELNNPINNITLTAHMLLEDYSDLSDDERIDMARDLIDEAGRARNIVRNLLDFARESETIMEPICIGSVLMDTLKLAGNQIKLAGINVDIKITPNLPRIHGDRHQLEQVFLNLILNALDVTLKGGHLKIFAGPSEEHNFISIKITDYGNGIPDHILQHIFDPFFTTKSKGKGTGLGLSVSQGIIAKHGGQITVNTQVARGTTFTVKLPITTIPADLAKCGEKVNLSITT
ncbi:integral membrane sensor signal transduction histidine kinase [Candidatus Magnetobacterium bavaricum]|uniref:histidine kinase n=1 Tax=Candidatus Magnetobacterium bavaricum TaxID=29290 RepID=A0A0F3GQM0_9BACT|nr:integral membrane sensor signal transduction histidine kinase [Candidatus Magnetobacterium bavaricum]